MAGRLSGELKIHPLDVAIGFLPLAVGVVGGVVLDRFGRTTAEFDMVLVSNSQLEAALRLRMLGTWILANAVAMAAIAYFVWTLRLFRVGTQILLLAAYAGVAAIGIYIGSVKGGGNSEVLMTRPLLCAPLLLADTGGAGETARLHVSPSTQWPPGRESRYAKECVETPSYRMLQSINNWQRYLLFLVLPALVLGAISCLPDRARKKSAPDVERLKIWIYLAAANFVSGLLYMSALLRWPGYAYSGASGEAYHAHVSAYVLYLGISFTIFIAAYYLPIYARLAGRRDASGPNAAAPMAPADLIKIVLGIFSPAIAGLLGDVLAI